MVNPIQTSIKNLAMLLLSAALLISCDLFQEFQIEKKRSSNGMKVVRINYAPDYSSFTVDVKIDKALSPCQLTDKKNVKFKTTEWLNEYEMCPEESQPELTDIANVRVQELRKLDLKGLVLVDMTLPAEQIKKTHQVTAELSQEFADDLYLAFITPKGVSETFPVTPYLLKNYFTPQESTQKALYRAILTKAHELSATTSPYSARTKSESSFWDTIPAAQKFMIVLSDGKVYADNRPMDPSHFDLAQQIVNLTHQKNNPAIYYVNYDYSANEEEDDDDLADGDPTNRSHLSSEQTSRPILELLCKQTNGLYFDKPDWTTFTNSLLLNSNTPNIDYQFTFHNPDLKVYRGQKHFLELECYANDTLYASFVEPYTLGSMYNPLIINGLSLTQVILQGVLICALMILLIYLMMQFVVPYIRYQYFKRRYIVSYKSKSDSYNGMMVGESCYYCKAPFEVGEDIVVKCKHILHKACWDENSYRCPEYGRRCSEGSHYYNGHNLLDKRNSTFYFLWIVYGVLSGLLAWVLFMYRAQYHDYTVNYLITKIYNLEVNTPHEMETIMEYGSQLFFMPFFGFSICFFLTLFLSHLVKFGHWRKRFTMCLMKAFVAGVCGYIAFTLGCVISLLIDLDTNSLLIDSIPWCLSLFIIAFVVAYGSNINLKRVLKGAAFAIVFGLGSMYFWDFINSRGLDSRLLCLFSCLIYTVGLAVSIASITPSTEYFFLRVTGLIKEMDLALYKWMKAPLRNQIVSIGKSVDCDLQIVWDLETDIAPVQVEIKMDKGALYLIPIEKGVIFMGKKMKLGLRKRLYHGDYFEIGKTKFTYVEKDI